MRDKPISVQKRKQPGGSAKTVALLKPQYDADVVSIYEIKKDATRWREIEFFCVAGFFSMTAAPGRTPPMFVFKSRHGAPANANRIGGGEGVVHELAKLHLASTKRLSILVKEWVSSEAETQFEFEFVSVEIEYPVHVGDTTYWVDLLATLRPDSPLALRFGQQIAIEIKDQNAVGFGKREDLRRAGLTTVEIQLSQKMHITFEEAADRQLLADRRRWLGNFFRKSVRATFLHRRDYLDLAERRDTTAKAQDALGASQYPKKVDHSIAPAVDNGGSLHREKVLPTSSPPSDVVTTMSVPAVPVESPPQAPPLPTPSSFRTSPPRPRRFPSQRKPGLLDRFRDWLKSLWVA